MAFIDAKTGKQVELKTGYETPRSISYQEWKKQQDQKWPQAVKTSALSTPTMNQLKQQEQQAMVDMDMDTLNRVRNQMKDMRASQGRQTVSDRLGNMTGAVFGSATAALSNIAGTAADTAGELVRAWEGPGDSVIAKNRAAQYREILKTGRLTDGRPVTPGMRPQLEAALEKYETEAARPAAPQKPFQERHPALSKAKENAYRLADQAQADTARFTGQAKEGLGKAGQLAVDVGIAGGQMGLDALTAALTGGSTLIPMAVRSFGGAAQQARQAGADLSQQLGYGLGSAALSVGTERISNIAGPFRKLYGTGAAEKIAGKLADRYGESQAVKLMTNLSRTAGGRIALSGGGEGLEELVEARVQPVLQRMTYDKDAKYDPKEARYNFLVGALLGAAGAGAESVGRLTRNWGKNQVEADTDVVSQANNITSPENIARYRRVIDDVFSGKYPSGRIITLGETPDILQKYGAKPLTMTMKQSTAYKIAYPERYLGGKHNLGMSVLKQLPYQLENPVAILKSNTQKDSLVILTEWMDGDKGIIIPIHLDKNGGIDLVNNVASAYKMRRYQGYFGDNNQNVLYSQKGEDIRQLLSKGVQFPQAMADDVLARNSITETSADVNSGINVDKNREALAEYYWKYVGKPSGRDAKKETFTTFWELERAYRDAVESRGGRRSRDDLFRDWKWFYERYLGNPMGEMEDEDED